MPNDIYIRTEGDTGFIANVIEIEDELAQLLLQIEVLLFTRKGDILGDHRVGINLEDYLYSLGSSASEINGLVTDQINSYCPLSKKYRPIIKTRFFKGTARDIAVIDITLTDGRSTGIVIV